ncbi:MAG: FG-GAP-like repeat-containing protein [Reichenbachiella sp.]|uniref:FG-GAP-like repeat-containing protein n=1 Tax=Reichenbachiella sp. TaxID=2184521 RepID=UPI00326748E8
MKLYLLVSLIFITTCLSAQSFEKIDNAVTQAVNSSRATTFIDVDKDGWLDIFITNGKETGENNVLYMNDGTGNFEENTESVIVKDNSPSDGATWGDIDNDGFEDLFVVTWYGKDNYLYKNLGETFTTNAAIEANGFSETASWADYDKDGYLDLYITNSSLGSGSSNQFYINNGDGTFSRNSGSVTTEARLNSRSVNWIDYDNDNDLDLFVSNEGAINELYINNDGTLSKLASGELVSSVSNSTGSSWADYDNDGDLDLYVANFGQANEFFENLGDGNFSKITGQNLVQRSDNSFGTAWGDIDNDGDLDLYIANGFKSGESLSNRLYINNADGTFTEDTEHTIVSDVGWSFGAAFGDYDNDGQLDLLVANTFEESQKNGLYHNLGNSNNWLIVDLEGTSSNRSAIGAKVKVTATIGDNEVVQMREISSQSCYNGQNSIRAHFGVGTATIITKIEIVWPNGNSEAFLNKEVNQILKIKETVPDGFLRADFALRDAVYLSNSTIEIIDLSVYPEGESVTYEWDFDNDGQVDSTEPSPTVSFTELGDYSIHLVVKSGSKTSEKLKADYLRVRATLLGASDSRVDNGLMVFPNPVVDRLTFKSDFKVNAVEIVAMDGSKVLGYSFYGGGTNDLKIEQLNLKEGIYTLVLTGHQNKEYIKFLIKK